MARNLNEIVISGNLVGNAIYKETKSDRVVTEFVVAVSNDVDPAPAYISVDAWDALAEITSDWQKGDRVIVSGRIKGVLRQNTSGRHQQLVLVAAWLNQIS